MTIEIRKPELKQRLQEECNRGNLNSVDDLLTEARQALREESRPVPAARQPLRKNLAAFLLESPFASSDLDLERRQDCGRPAEPSKSRSRPWGLTAPKFPM